AFAVSGSLDNFQLAGLVAGSAHFSVTKQLVNATVPPGSPSSLTNAPLLTVTLSNLQLRIGTNDVGLRITGGSLTVVSLAPADPADHRSWLAVNASGISGSLAVGSGAQATLAQIAVRVNKATNSTPLDWSTALGTAVPAGVSGISGDLLAVSGQVVTLNVADLLSGSAQFAVTKQTVTATLPTTGATSSMLMTVTLSNLFL